MNALDSLANNLANANTTGFKEDRTFFAALEASGAERDRLSAAVNAHTTLGQAVLNLTDGTVQRTDRPLDLALSGNGFLVVQTPHGPRYTRNGGLVLNSASQLAMRDGSPVLGVNGPIKLGTGRIEISSTGEVYVDRVRVDRLKLAKFAPSVALEREGDSLLSAGRAEPDPTPATVEVRQGYLEQSNVNPVVATIRMVDSLRQFEAIQKSVHLMMNEMDAKSIERLGR
jgi:flagellar basal body rod protein FlgG